MAGKNTAIAVGFLFTGVALGAFGFKMFFAEDVAISAVDPTTEAVERSVTAEDFQAENSSLKDEIANLKLQLSRRKLAEADQTEEPDENDVKAAAADPGGRLGAGSWWPRVWFM